MWRRCRERGRGSACGWGAGKTLCLEKAGRSACSHRCAAPPLGERLRDCFRTTRVENNSPLLGLAFPFQPLAKHWPRALCTAPSKLRCACRHLYRCVNVDAALGRFCAAYLLVLASFCTGTELRKHKCFCELSLVKDLNFASAERFLHGQSVPALHESGNGKGGQNRAWTEVSACIINRDTNVM